MWTGLYPGKPEDEVPIGHITNGVHVPSWLAPQMFRLYDRHLGIGWQDVREQRDRVASQMIGMTLTVPMLVEAANRLRRGLGQIEHPSHFGAVLAASFDQLVAPFLAFTHHRHELEHPLQR